ncbi:MAG: zf-TFIIB domain-containing protein [bacterium]
MILACPECTRQYRVDKYPAGQHVRCLCGQSMTVPESVAHQARILHCADCGGPLKQGATECEYCGGVLDPLQKHYTLVCPRCFARLPEDARFCIECAQAIRPQEVVQRRRSRRRCPRCKEALQSRVMESIGFDECPACLGLWLSEEEFKLVCDRKVQEFRDNPLPDAHRPAAVVDKVTYLPCPVCQSMMNRQNFGRVSGVIIDRCRGHGVWLDNTELERIAKFIVDGGLARSRQVEAEEIERRTRVAERQAAPAGSVLTSRVESGGGGFSFLRVLSGFFD